MAMPDAILTKEEQAFALSVRSILHCHVLPEADAAEERGYLPAVVWQALAEQGLLELPRQGQGFLKSAVFLEELGGLGYAGLRAAIGVHAYMASAYIAWFGSDEQRRRYLPGVGRGQAITALAITEEQAGSDLSQLQCQARATDDGFVVEGRKRYVANGSQASLIVMLVGSSAARHPLGGSSMLLIDANSPGISRSPQALLGWRSADVCDLDFQQVRVSRQDVLGRVGKGFQYLMRGLDFERLVAGFLALGGAEHSIRVLSRFSEQRHVKGAPLNTYQSVRHRLADLISEQQLLRSFAYQLARQYSVGQIETRDACILKLRATELAKEAALTCVQYHGAQGYLRDSVVSRLCRDAMAGTIAGGASEVMRDMIFSSAALEVGL
jgi:alkylation response protein AidB-like acyl-CoA dehydrogenase